MDCKSVHPPGSIPGVASNLPRRSSFQRRSTTAREPAYSCQPAFSSSDAFSFSTASTSPFSPLRRCHHTVS